MGPECRAATDLEADGRLSRTGDGEAGLPYCADMAKEKAARGFMGGAPVYKARGRALTDQTNLSRQTDSLAYTVQLLQESVAEQRRTNELLLWVGQCIQAQSGKLTALSPGPVQTDPDAAASPRHSNRRGRAT